MRNWAGNYEYRAVRLHRPESIEELQELVRRTPRLRPLGSRHSFNDIADTDGDLVALDRLPRTVEIDHDRRTVTVHGGIRYGDLCPILERAGLALHNTASLPHISVAGAVATGTHGSGDRSGSLATAIRALKVVTADGEIASFDRGDPASAADFPGAVVSLGALGPVVRLTLDVEPTYRMRQDVYDDLPLAALDDHFDDIMAAADSVSLFTDWRAPRFHHAWLKTRLPPADPGTADAGADDPGIAAAPPRPHPTSMELGPLPSPATRSRASRPRPARSSSAAPDRGTTGSPTSGSTTRRVPARRSRASTSSPANTPSMPSGPSTASPGRSPTSSRRPRSARSPPTSSG